jgi:hypothetical protein
MNEYDDWDDLFDQQEDKEQQTLKGRLWCVWGCCHEPWPRDSVSQRNQGRKPRYKNVRRGLGRKSSTHRHRKQNFKKLTKLLNT